MSPARIPGCLGFRGRAADGVALLPAAEREGRDDPAETRGLPRIALFVQHGADQINGGPFAGEYSYDLSAAPDVAVQARDRVGGM